MVSEYVCVCAQILSHLCSADFQLLFYAYKHKIIWHLGYISIPVSLQCPTGIMQSSVLHIQYFSIYRITLQTGVIKVLLYPKSVFTILNLRRPTTTIYFCLLFSVYNGFQLSTLYYDIINKWTHKTYKLHML